MVCPVASPLLELPFVHDPIDLPDIGLSLSVAQAKNLALRNMVRDRYTYQLASGQHVSAYLGTPGLPMPAELAAKGFKKTPLWYACLQEAETHGGGKMTGAGGAIVASVFARMLQRDPTTFVHIPHFQPWGGFGGQPSVFAGMLAYMEANRGAVVHADALKCG